MQKQTEFQVVAIGQVHESRTNPRKHFAKDALAELTASVKEKGILVPLLVRPGRECKIYPILAGNTLVKFEVIAGARRLRAARAAGLETIPVLVRELTDEQALEVQVVENLQRADVHPLEEAEGYKQLLAKGKYDIPALAAKVGKSESYLYQRLKLAELVPAAKKAFEEDVITAGHAILLARLQPKDQLEALKSNDEPGGSFVSVRDLASWIHGNVHLELKTAPWDLDDAALVAKAGSCRECPKRSGANPQLFPDVKAKDVCTDPGCFDGKLQAHLVQIRGELEKAGHRVVLITMSYDKKKDGVLLTSDWRLAETNAECKGLAIGLVVEGGWHRKEYRRGAQVRVCTDKKCKVHWNSYEHQVGSAGGSRSPSQKKWDRLRRRELDRRGRLFKALVDKGPYDEREDETRRAIGWVIQHLDHDHAERLCEAMGWEPKRESYGQKNYTGAMQERLAKMPLADAEGWILYAVIADEDLFFGAYLNKIPKSELLEQCVKRAKVDVRAIEKQVAEKWEKKAKVKPKAGVCRICGCTEKKACEISLRNGKGGLGGCSWTDNTKTLCSNPKCIAAVKRKKAA